MGFDLLTNTAFQQCSRLIITDSSNVDLEAEDALSVSGGHMHLEYTQSGTAEERIIYDEGATGLSYDTVVAARADRYNTHGVDVREYTTYPGASSDEFTTTTFAETLVGYNSDIWVYERSTQATSLDAIGLILDNGTGGAYTKTVNKVVFANKLSFPNVQSFIRTPLRRDTIIERDGQPYQCDNQLIIQFKQVSDADLESFDKLFRVKEEPFFIYDSGGDWLTDKCWPVIMNGFSATHPYPDDNILTITVSKLKEYTNT